MNPSIREPTFKKTMAPTNKILNGSGVSLQRVQKLHKQEIALRFAGKIEQAREKAAEAEKILDQWAATVPTPGFNSPGGKPFEFPEGSKEKEIFGLIESRQRLGMEEIALRFAGDHVGADRLVAERAALSAKIDELETS